MDKPVIVFFSSCIETWGGSEELWSQAAEMLARRGFAVHIFKLSVEREHPRIKSLAASGCEITDLNEYLPPLARRVWNRFLPFNRFRTLPFYIKKVLGRRVRKLEPDLFVISQGNNFDGLPYVEFCPLDRTPYVIISQKAIEYLFPNDWAREGMKRIWSGSAMNYFVSKENLETTERQFATKLDRAEVVRNPFLTRTDGPLDWDFPEGGLRIACVGRAYVLDKGQDVLLRVMAMKKWRERDVTVSFYGKGVNAKGIEELAGFLDLKNVEFRGHTSDVHSIWREHQVLALPSRNEGTPLVVVEAMMCGRVPVVTDLGGNLEVVEDGNTGFIAESPSVRHFDRALERLWERREELRDIGRRASESIRSNVPEDPGAEFADKLESIISRAPAATRAAANG